MDESHVTYTALSDLHAWDRGLPIRGGVAFEERLRKVDLDYSVRSLARIDSFLDELREAQLVDASTLVDEPKHLALFVLLAFYVGEVIGRSLRTEPTWLTFDEYNEVFPGDPSDACFETSLVLGFAGVEGVRSPYFKPLISIVSRATSPEVEKSVLFSAGLQLPESMQSGLASEMPLEPLPPRLWPFDLAAWRASATPTEIGDMLSPTPHWAQGDDLMRLFEGARHLLLHGRVVWGALIQANSDLYNLTQLHMEEGAPGEVVFDPRGRVAPQTLAAIAAAVYSLKGRAVDKDAAAARVAGYLADERERVFGLDVPSSVTRYPLKISTTWFSHRQLPLRALVRRHFPLLISDDHPGLVLPLPSRLWPADFTQSWLDAGKDAAAAKGMSVYIPPLELAHLHPASLVEEGMLYFDSRRMPPNYDKARQAWQQAADQGKYGGFRGLAQLYERGAGVPHDLRRALDHYELAVIKGCRHSAQDAHRLRSRLGLPTTMPHAPALPQSPAALHDVAMDHLEGRGTPKDVRNALALLERAGGKGHAHSLYVLGGIYQNGDDVRRDARRAMGYMQRAADAGSAEAQAFLKKLKRNVWGYLAWRLRR